MTYYAHTHARVSQAKAPHCWGEFRPEVIACLKAQRHASFGVYKEVKETQSIRTYTTEGFVCNSWREVISQGK